MIVQAHQQVGQDLTGKYLLILGIISPSYAPCFTIGTVFYRIQKMYDRYPVVHCGCVDPIELSADCLKYEVYTVNQVGDLVNGFTDVFTKYVPPEGEEISLEQVVKLLQEGGTVRVKLEGAYRQINKYSMLSFAELGIAKFYSIIKS